MMEGNVGKASPKIGTILEGVGCLSVYSHGEESQGGREAGNRQFNI